MREVVDLAFKLVYIKYRKLDVPLVLDEFGSSMDTTHQINSYNIIGDKLVNNFSQIFIVSHFESMYGRFSNSDISILDSSNLTVDTYKDTSVMLFNVGTEF
jgi:ABC-type hemin transport system ATPase subunit